MGPRKLGHEQEVVWPSEKQLRSISGELLLSLWFLLGQELVRTKPGPVVLGSDRRSPLGIGTALWQDGDAGGEEAGT